MLISNLPFYNSMASMAFFETAKAFGETDVMLKPYKVLGDKELYKMHEIFIKNTLLMEIPGSILEDIDFITVCIGKSLYNSDETSIERILISRDHKYFYENPTTINTEFPIFIYA